jgi:hypothetical protein
MKFMVTLISDRTAGESAAPEQMEEMATKMKQFMGEIGRAGVLADPGAPLAPSETARTLRYGENGRSVVTDGPFAESKEQIAGYMVLECEDLDAAVGWVERMPVIGTPSIEVRPIAEPPGSRSTE